MKINSILFKALEKAENTLHETLGFSKEIQLPFEPLYGLCKTEVSNEKDIEKLAKDYTRDGTKHCFEEPVPQHIKDEVNCQVRIIDTAIEFANWIHDNYIGYGSYSQPKLWYPHDTITQSYTTSELWQIFLNEKENEK